MNVRQFIRVLALAALAALVVVLAAVVAKAQTVRSSTTISNMPSTINSAPITPVGTVVAFQAGSEPDGNEDWLECTGAAIPGDSKYDKLRGILGSNNVPDLRQEFLRGGDASLVGTAVPDSIKSHDVQYVQPTITPGPAGGSDGWVPNTQIGEAHYTGTAPRGVDETAPRHIYTRFYIRARQ
jgi:hypothetical protein